MKQVIAAVGALMVTSACSAVGIRSSWEQPPYEVVAQLSDTLEVRRYAPRIAAEATAREADERQARNAAFRVLFGYITGKNQAGAEIAMTTPVETFVAPGQEGSPPARPDPSATRDAVGDVSMRFFLPAELTAETSPRPADARVRIVTVPAQTMAVLRFSGATDPDAIAAKKAQLAESLAGTPWRAEGRMVAFFYDPPWTVPFLRRNEVAVAVVDAGGRER